MIIQKLIYLVFAALTLAASAPREGFRSEFVLFTGEEPIVLNTVDPRITGFLVDAEELMPAHEKGIEMFAYYVAKKSGSHNFYNFGPHKRWFYFGATACDVDPRKSIQESTFSKFIETNFERVTVDLVEGEVYPIRVVETPDFVNAPQKPSAISITFIEGPAGFENLIGNSYTGMSLKDKVEPSKSGGCAAPVVPHKGQIFSITNTDGRKKFAALDSARGSEVHENSEFSTIYGKDFNWFQLSYFNYTLTGYFKPKKEGVHRFSFFRNGCVIDAEIAGESKSDVNTHVDKLIELLPWLSPGEYYPFKVSLGCNKPQLSFSISFRDPDIEYHDDFSNYVVEEKP